jgi:hypothetical protein
MAKGSDAPTPPPTTTRILEQFSAALREDTKIPAEAASRIEALLRKGKVPKVEDLQAAIFATQEEEPI